MTAWSLASTCHSGSATRELTQPEAMFSGGALVLEDVWRSGLFGFVYGAVLRKPSSD